MWDCRWQDSPDYGTKYDYGVFEVHPALMDSFYKHKVRDPAIGFVGSLLFNGQRCKLPRNTQVVDQKRWTDIGLQLGGSTRTGKLQFTRGTIAACWAIETIARAGDEVVLVGFDNISARKALPIEIGFSPAYRADPATFTFRGYIEGKSRYGNHDFTVELPVLEHLARCKGAVLSFADRRWSHEEQATPQPKIVRPLTALVLGDAKCVQEDAALALAMFEPDAVAAVNNIGVVWPGRVDYWFTLHPSPTRDWKGIARAMKSRLQAGLNQPEVWAHKMAPGVDRQTSDWAMSSGGFAVKCLRAERFERIILAGVPMTREGAHFYGDKPWSEAETYRHNWVRRKDELAPFVRSVSGFTRELFGPPDPDWIGR